MPLCQPNTSSSNFVGKIALKVGKEAPSKMSVSCSHCVRIHLILIFLQRVPVSQFRMFLPY